MRVAALYDVHGNLPALEAVLADHRVATADLVVCGGDLVAGPMPRDSLERLLNLDERVRFIRGNGDRQVVDAAEPSSSWCRERLDEAHLNEVRDWPLTLDLDLPLGPTTFTHATPRSDEEIVTRVTPTEELADALGDTSGTLVVGHTHVQFDLRVGRTRLVNAGSVGMPYEGRAAAFWALLESDVELCSTEYDPIAAAAAIRATGYPSAENAAQTLLAPHTAADATAHFESLRGA